jgi:hypothetical protein
MNIKDFSQILNLPKLPNDLIEECIAIVKHGKTKVLTTDKFHFPKITNPDGKEVSGSAYLRFSLTDILEKWVKENIKSINKSGIASGVQIYWSKDDLFSYAGHVDGARGRVVLYSIDPGGENVETVWFKEHNKPLFRKYNEDFVGGIVNLQSLEKIHSINVAAQEWTILETRVIHAVTNMHRPRISLAVGISDDEVDEFCKAHRIDKNLSDLWLSSDNIFNKN